MKKIFLIAILNLIILKNYSQTVTNVVAIQKDSMIIISYDLICEGDVKISLFEKEESSGEFVGPLESVTGDVGNGITAGNKKIFWNVLNDCEFLVGKLIFKVVGLSKYGKMVDVRDGKSYKTVQIGEQLVMAENLNCDLGTNWQIEGKYGRLYDWDTAKNICPCEWHLPKKSEFETMLNNISISNSSAYSTLSTNGTSGFNALLGGCRNWLDAFYRFEEWATFWTYSEANSQSAWFLRLSKGDKGVKFDYWNKVSGFSVRCFHD